MKTLFAMCGVVLVGLTVLTVGTLPERRSDVPLLYWTSDPNPARGPQMAAFEKWMADKGYGAVDLELDSNNTGTMKVIIQSVSGVGSEIIDVYGGANLRKLVSAGVLMDVTELAKEYGFGLDKTYTSAGEEITVDGRQYTFPCNVTGWPLTINRALLEREGLPLPKFDWNCEEFLDWCKEVRKVDANGRVTRYAVWPFEAWRLWPTFGGSIFNETMTHCVLDCPQVIDATKFYYDLMFEHKVMPTPVERASMAGESGYGGLMVQALGNEIVAAVSIGRFGLIQLREFKNFKPDVALYPHKVMPMTFVSSRSAGINAVAARKGVARLAARFQQFLAGETYNRIIIDDADALPPIPEMAKLPEFLTPAEYPGEHVAHKKYYRAVAEFGVGSEYSRFVSPITVQRIISKFLSGIDSRELTVKQALKGMADEINIELRRTVERDPRLQEPYKKALARQAEIDKLKAEDRPVPLEWLDNPVIRRLREAGQ